MSVMNVIGLLCGVALFLFGMSLMGDGLKKVAGKRLEVILYKLTSNPFKGILLGTGVTAVIQSSSATSVMVVGFVNSGMMKVRQAIGIIMGAIIGTSVTGWVICLSSVSGGGLFELLSTDTLTALMAIGGIILLMFTKKEANHHTAHILLGFAVLMVGISLMTDAVYPLRESPAFISMLTSFKNPLIGILIGILFTSVIQSASAAVGILQTLSVTGAVSFSLALPVIMGIAIGASVPVLLSALGANVNGRKAALIYLLVDLLGAILFGAIFYSLNAIFHFDLMNTTMSMASIALLNTVFRVIIVVLLMPFIGLLERIANRLIPDRSESVAELRDVERLEERFVNYPALAIEQTRIAINSMAGLACESVEESLALFDHFSQEGLERVGNLEQIIDTYEDRLGSYIVRLMKNEMDYEQNKLISLYLHSINDFERIGDHAKNLSEAAQEINEKKIVFSSGAQEELRNLGEAIREILSKTRAAFLEEDLSAAFRIAPLEEVVDDLCDQSKARHVERVQKDVCEYNHGFVFNDMLTDFERISDHCANLGIAVRIRHGELDGRHGAITKDEIEKTHHYQEYYNEYRRIYSA